MFDCVSCLVVEIDVTQLRVNSVNHKAYFAKVVILDYKGNRLSDVAASTMNTALERV